MNLFLVHCGYYDPEIGDGLFENHYNFFVVAEIVEKAKLQAKSNPLFRPKIGLQKIEVVLGYRLQ
jgi:hypothetical protein